MTIDYSMMSNIDIHDKFNEYHTLLTSKFSTLKIFELQTHKINILDACIIHQCLELKGFRHKLSIAEAMLEMRCNHVINRNFNNSKAMLLFKDSTNIGSKRNQLLFKYGIMCSYFQTDSTETRIENKMFELSNKLQALRIYTFNKHDIYTCGLWNIAKENNSYICLFSDGFRYQTASDIFKLLSIGLRNNTINNTDFKIAMNTLITKSAQASNIKEIMMASGYEPDDKFKEMLGILYSPEKTRDLFEYLNLGFNVDMLINNLINTVPGDIPNEIQVPTIDY